LNSSFIAKVAKSLNWALAFFAFLVLGLILLDFNYSLKASFRWGIRLCAYLLIGIYLLQTIFLFFTEKNRLFKSFELIVKAIISGAILITYSQPYLAAGLIIIEEALRTLQNLLQKASVTRLLDRLRTQPALLLASSFAAVIATGSILLSLPVATTAGRIDFVDALFTATSATCVTGLSVQDTGTFFTPFGQGIILALIQIGGLGIMTMSTSLALLIGKRLSIRERLFMQNVIEENDYQEFARIIRNIFRMTFICEGIGALILSLRWYAEFNDVRKAIYYGIFHSISAFCNAGFALFPNSFENYQSDPVINLTITALIICGGIGFAVMYGLYTYFHSPLPRRLTLHVKMTLTVTAILLVGGMFFCFFVEYSGSMLEKSLADKLWIAWFQSVTLRTAGFNTIPISQLSNATLFLFMVWMFIGGSPGSTAGGIKTTTVGVLFATLRSMLSGRESVESFGRSIPWDIVRKSISITFVAGGVVSLGLILIALVESFPLREMLFEVVSATGTVGLSLDVTAKLTSAGKTVITVLMYIGRIGPLTIAFLIGTEGASKGYYFPTGKIIVG
jgi:trk system potassium uptake protein TrkH